MRSTTRGAKSWGGSGRNGSTSHHESTSSRRVGDELLGDHYRQRSHQGVEGVRSPGRGIAGRLPGCVGTDQGSPLPLAGFTGRNLMPILDAALGLLEETAADGQSVHEVLGDDIRGFCTALAGGEGARTYRDRWREQLNRNVARKLSRLGG